MQTINELWAWVVTDADGDEGVLRLQTAEGYVPMIMGTREQIEQHGDRARAAAAVMGLEVSLAVYERRSLTGPKR